ncbi:CGNR zinc finger domain-containing protein [Planotetraspora mira]|uniref:CGNR zinc finger domain-containing protein n=1 Tax=Planotetraspora mira TaxID=58121 RepID=UPI00194FB2B9|nr:CGNR zinc finger domain-containing protein [Planotetraspora mira]
MVEWPPTGPVKVWHAERAGGFDAVLAHIARDAVDVVTGPRAQTISRCEVPGCVRIFLREHARRISCSTTCGDRVRAERHYRLHQAGRDG